MDDPTPAGPLPLKKLLEMVHEFVANRQPALASLHVGVNTITHALIRM
jgi:hypothetical protein